MDGDYDYDRYDKDSDYADGVDDAMDEFDEDWQVWQVNTYWKNLNICLQILSGIKHRGQQVQKMPHNPAAVNRAIKRIVDTHNSEEEVAAKKEKREPIMIPRFSCHIFRHTFASRFCENETNIKVIQEVMGHADVSTTMNIYAEANPDVTKSVIEKLSKNMDIFQKRVL